MKLATIFAGVLLLSVAMAAQATVFTENSGHATMSRLGGGTNLAPYGWWGPNGTQVWEEFRKYYASTNSTEQIYATNSTTDATKATVYKSTCGPLPNPGYSSPGLFVAPDGQSTPSNAIMSISQMRHSASGTADVTELRVGFIETADLAAFLNAGSKHGDGYFGHNSEVDYYAPDTPANLQYMYINIAANKTMGNVFGHSETGLNTPGGRDEKGRANLAVTATGALAGNGPWKLTTRIYDDGGGNKRLEVNLGDGQWVGYFQINLAAAQTTSGTTAYKNGVFDWQHVTPVIFMGKGGYFATYIPDEIDIYMTSSATPPAVAMTAPASGFICGQGQAPVGLTATATVGTPASVTGVEFFDGAVKLGNAASGGGNTWNYSWDTTAATLGTHTIKAVATDGGSLTATSGTITVKVWIPGDADGSGMVDGLDYNTWQNGYQQPGATFATGDYDGNGQVDGLDYNVWQNNYGHTAAYVADGFSAMAAEPAAPGAAVAAASAPHITAVKRGTRNAERGTQDQQQQNSGDAVKSLTLVFDCAVEVGAGAVEVSGLATGGHADYAQSYDAATKSLTLTWPQPLAADVYTVRVVADFVVGAGGGAPLDGEVGDPSAPTLPSGDGVPGGDALLEFTAR